MKYITTKLPACPLCGGYDNVWRSEYVENGRELLFPEHEEVECLECGTIWTDHDGILREGDLAPVDTDTEGW